MSAGQGRNRTLAAVVVVASTMATGTAPALAVESGDGADPAPPFVYEVLVTEETAPGEAPVFEVVETDLGGLIEMWVDPAVETLELNASAELTWRPTDPFYPVQWEHIATGLEQAWDTTRGSEDIVIAVLDSGVAVSDDLGSRLLPGVSFVGGDPHVDPLGHGSSVAAVAAAGHNQTAGAGVCPRCTILPVQVATAQGAVPWSAAAEGLVWAVDQGADIVNMSFSSPAASPAMATAIAYALDAGVVVVASAGNYGTSDPAYPAAVDGVLAVSGHDAGFARYGWSSHGPWADVAAPGCTIGAFGGTACGTSFAAPWTAGLAGLMLASAGALSPAEVEARLEAGTVAVDWVETGRIDAAAVSLAPWAPPAPPAPVSPARFADVMPGAFYEHAVNWMVAEEITTGTTPGTFSPEAPLTRGQVATFLWRMEGRPGVVAGASPAVGFADVTPGSFYAEAVAWMVAEGITAGTAPETFSPEDPVTRAQLATFMWRHADRPDGTTVGFADVVPGSFYAEAVAWMVDAGITTGTSPGTFSPEAVVTRGQLVTFLWRFQGQPV